MLAQASVDWAQTGIIGALVLIALVSGMRGVWIWGGIHREIVADRDTQLSAKAREVEEWKRIALTQAGILEQQVQTVERVVTRVSRDTHG